MFSFAIIATYLLGKLRYYEVGIVVYDVETVVYEF